MQVCQLMFVYQFEVFLQVSKVQKSSAFKQMHWAMCQNSTVVLTDCSHSQGHAADVFEAYTQLLTEMVLRLPYQIKKIADTNSRIPPPVFDHSWFYFLSEVRT